MRLRDLRDDPDPLPRPAPVGPGSAYAAVAAASPVAARVVETSGRPAGRRRSRLLSTWLLDPLTGATPRLVTVPHCWARAEPDLADHKGPVEYRRVVERSGDDPTAFARHLVLRQVDYVARVDVAGLPPVWHEGGFTPVLAPLPPGDAPVEVTVRVDDPVEPTMLGPDPLVAAKRKVKGVFEFHDSRPGGLIQGVHWTGAWAQRHGTGGITEPVELVETGAARLDATFVRCGTEGFSANWVVTNLTGAEIDLELAVDVVAPAGQPTAAFVVAARVPPGPHRIAVRADAAVDDDDRWHPAHAGRPAGAVHELRTDVRIDGSVSDASTVRFGVRDADVRLEPDAPFEVHVNGRRLYNRSLNHIPGVWVPELDEATLRRDVALAAEAGADSLGPHAHVLPHRFYDACDDAGMLVFQDFPLNLAHDPDGAALFDGGPTMAEASLLLAAEAAYDLFNHPSVVYWCGHNEPAYQLGQAFRASDHPILVDLTRRMLGAPDEEALDDRRVELWRHVDPTRAAFPASGLGRFRDVGDTHTYSGSLSADPVTAIADVEASFVSEFGAWFPNWSAAAPGGAVAATGDWPPPPGADADWEHRAHIYASCAMRAGRPERSGSFAEWAWAAQLHAALFAKLGIEGLRRRRWAPSRGHRWHLFVDHFGDAGAGLLDRHRTAQLPYWAVAAANRPLLAVAAPPPSNRVAPGRHDIRWWVVDDRPVPGGDVVVGWSLRRLAEGEVAVVGADEPGVEQAFGRPAPPAGDAVVVPLGVGALVAGGATTARSVLVDPTTGCRELEPIAIDVDEGAWCVELSVRPPDGPDVRNWLAFVCAPAAWEPAPGPARPTTWPLAVRGAGGPVSVRRRWAGTTMATSTTGSLDASLPPDQYVVSWPGGERAVDLYGPVEVDTTTGDAVASGFAPWVFRP